MLRQRGIKDELSSVTSLICNALSAITPEAREAQIRRLMLRIMSASFIQ